jgi:rRNA-processing protein FCF1
MKIILDTNFLIDCIRFNINIKSELVGNELFVLDLEKFEMEKIIERGTKESKLAKTALEFVNKNKIKILESGEKDVDESLIKYSKEGYVIATHDRVLKNKLKKSVSKIIFIRQKKYLVIE